MQRTNIFLEERQTEALDRLAAAEGVSRAEIIRRLLDRALVGTDDRASDIAAFEASFGSWSDAYVVAPDRAPGARESRLDEMWSTGA